MQDFQDILNPEQYAAATAGDGPLLVLAAAGTGKTQTLVYRVAHLVNSGVDPRSILLLTFTNRAAHEMLERAKDVIGDSVSGVWGGTFHHICNRLLRRHAALLDFRSNFTIADREDSRKMIDEVMKQQHVKGGRDFPKRDVILSYISNAANRDIPLSKVLEEQISCLSVDVAAIERVAEGYAMRKEELGVMDFDDLLVNGLRLFEDHPDVLDYYKRQFQYILVDEYQDTNTVQSKFVDLLAGPTGNIMAVGDDFQCIYTWRGADFRNIMDFPKRYPTARIIKLERNYRSTPEILVLANACIAGNPEQFQKTLTATRNGGGKPVVVYLRDGYEQSRAVARLIREQISRGRRPNEIAVLYRAHFHSIDLQMQLTHAGIPYTVTSGIGVFEQAHVKDMISLLRIISDPLDNLAFSRVFTLLPGIGDRSADSLWVKLGGKCDLTSQEGREQVLKALKPAAREAWEPVSKAISFYFDSRDEDIHENVVELVSSFIDGFYYKYLKKNFENYEDRADDVREVALEVARSGDLETFLQEVSLMSNVEAVFDKSPERENDSVRLSSVHQAKGLEWPVVIILWAAEGMFPSSRAIGADGDDAEERRLFYVAVTRAQNVLYICCPGFRRGYDGGVYACQPSRFVTEIPQSAFQSRFGLNV